MAYKIKQTLLLVVFVLVLPLLPHRELLLTWPVLVAFLAGLFVNLTQPAVSTETLKKRDAQDQRSALFIYAAAITVFLVPVLDYGYLRQARPSITAPWSLVGLALIVGGLAFRYWSIRVLGRFFTSVVTVQNGQTVIDHGPYKKLRHPSYLGSFAMAIGLSLVFRSYVGLAACFLTYFPAYIYRIGAEEAVLTAELGVPYEEYKKRTWRMLPLVY